jgi:uncharacterized RDD family membrane protein YckC
MGQPAPQAVLGAEPSAEVATASFGRRLGAAFIDGVLVFFIGFLTVRLAFPLVLWLYSWLFIGLKGQTLGKMAFGIKVVNYQGDKPGLGVAALREIPGKLVSGMALLLGFLWVIWDRRKQGWHDKIAKTYVVRVEPGREKGG